MQSLGDMAFDHVIAKLKRYITIFTKIQSQNLVEIHDTIALSHVIYYNSFFFILICHSCMSWDHVIY